MIFIILGIIVPIIIVCAVAYDCYRAKFECEDIVGASIMSGMVSFMICVGLCFLLCVSFPNEKIEGYNSIVSLMSNQEISGNFFLGCGTIKEIEYYFYYAKTGHNSYKRRKISVSDTTIIETDEISPRLAWTDTNNKVPRWIGPDLVGTQGNYRLYVPKNTIVKQFRLE